MVATDQPVCDFVHAHTSPVGDKRFTIVTIVHAYTSPVRGKRRPTPTPSRAIIPTFYVRLILDEGNPGNPN